MNSKNTSILPKLISGVLAAVLLLPMLIFTALPNTMFGYNSAMDQRVADFTASARRLTNAYQNIAQKNQSAMERLVNSILPGFSDYDDYHVTDGSGGMNQNWLIAIGSVRYKQDLNVMDGNALEDLLFGKLDYSASITDRVLNISVWDLTPEAYMDRLGFSQEEKDWAALLYSVMEEDQRVSIGDTDAPATMVQTTATLYFPILSHLWSTIIRRMLAGATNPMARQAPLAELAAAPRPWLSLWPP